jgi:hypothetical protein
MKNTEISHLIYISKGTSVTKAYIFLVLVFGYNLGYTDGCFSGVEVFNFSVAFASTICCTSFVKFKLKEIRCNCF